MTSGATPISPPTLRGRTCQSRSCTPDKVAPSQTILQRGMTVGCEGGKRGRAVEGGEGDRSYVCQCFTTASVESMMVPSMSKRKPSNVTRCGGAVKDVLVSAVEPMVDDSVPLSRRLSAGGCGM